MTDLNSGTFPATHAPGHPTEAAGISWAAVVSIDVGGTSIKGAVMATDGRTVATEDRPTPPGGQILAELESMYRSLSLNASSAGYTIAGVGAVTPGLVDETTGTVRYASNLGWRNVPLRSSLEQATGLPVAIGHDVRIAGLAEQLFGAARDCASYVLVPIGTGIAAAITPEGTPIGGHSNAAGELGHIPVIADGERCDCGQRGCLEVYASAEGVRRRYRALTGNDATAEQIVARLDTEPEAETIWADAVRALSLGLVTCTLLLDPEVFVIGGGLAASGDRLLVPLRSGLASGLAWRDAPAVQVAELGGSAARIGAGVLAFRAASMGGIPRAWRQQELLDLPTAPTGDGAGHHRAQCARVSEQA